MSFANLHPPSLQQGLEAAAAFPRRPRSWILGVGQAPAVRVLPETWTAEVTLGSQPGLGVLEPRGSLEARGFCAAVLGIIPRAQPRASLEPAAPDSLGFVST